MELLTNLKQNKDYCQLIKPSSYEQRISEYPKRKVYQNINHLFIDLYDPTCSILEQKDKGVYIKQRLVEVATELDENHKEKYEKFNYSKQMKPSLIQTGLQQANQLSSVVYLSDIYNVTPVIYIDSSQTKITLTEKIRKNLHILYKDGSFMELDAGPEFKIGDINDLQNCFVFNVKNTDFYKPYLAPLGKYKVSELTEIAMNINLPITVNGKKKVKKQLYDEINLYYLNK